MSRYSEKNAVITGGTSGIGFPMAQMLVDGGAHVAITGRSPASLEAARERLGTNATTVRGDVASVPVNAISPGPVDTGTLERTMTAEAAERFKAERAATNPMGRFGTPDEIAAAAAFLAFDATYTAGIELAVDGGATQL